jgi:predicted exporter
MLRRRDRWLALLPLRAPLVDGRPGPIDLRRVRAALAGRARAIDLAADANRLYSVYLRNALRASAVGVLAIAGLLAATLRSARRTLRVLAPLAVAVGAVAAALTLAAIPLTIMHLVGMLLIVAIGSNYALFFVRHAADDDGAMIGSLAVANAATVIGFGLLATAPVPVLRDLGVTVAPGALLAFLCSAMLAPTAPVASTWRRVREAFLDTGIRR